MSPPPSPKISRLQSHSRALCIPIRLIERKAQDLANIRGGECVIARHLFQSIFISPAAPALRGWLIQDRRKHDCPVERRRWKSQRHVANPLSSSHSHLARRQPCE